MQLSERSRPLIEATLPIVSEHIDEIAKRFYQHMFAGHPELLDGTFNRGHQAQGTQQEALAGSLAAYASALVGAPGQLPENLLARVAHKHASLGIQPDQYQIVHDNLTWAIADRLGDAVTPDVAAAWDEVYWLMADSLIHIERGLYSSRAGSARTCGTRTTSRSGNAPQPSPRQRQAGAASPGAAQRPGAQHHKDAGQNGEVGAFQR